MSYIAMGFFLSFLYIFKFDTFGGNRENQGILYSCQFEESMNWNNMKALISI